MHDLQSQKLIVIGRRKRGLYILNELKVSVVAASSFDLFFFRLSLFSFSFYLWHSHLGYISPSCLRFLASAGYLKKLQTFDISNCSGYKLIIFYALLFNQSIFVFSFPIDLIHSDV